MAKHEFGIMMDAPQQGKRYDEYEPWKYACISVDDAYLEGVVERLTSIDFYWHTLSVKGKGEYSCAMKSHFRKIGNQMSGSGNHLCEFTRVMFYLDRIPLASICHVQDQCL